MTDLINMDLLEMMASKLCHDLISPIGAINNGLEIMDELGPDAGTEVTDLIAFSANQASAKLKAYRLAYGAGGSDSNLKPEDAYNAIQSIVGAEDKVTQNWNPHDSLGFTDEFPKGLCKMLTATLLLALESLPKGGKIAVTSGADGTVIVKANGENAGMRGNSHQALMLRQDISTLEPKYVHPTMTGLIAKHYNFTIEVTEDGDDCIQFILKT